MISFSKNKQYDWVQEIGMDWSSVLCNLTSFDYSNPFHTNRRLIYRTLSEKFLPFEKEMT